MQIRNKLFNKRKREARPLQREIV